MAAIILAPIKLIHKYKIKSAVELSQKCNLPYDVSEDYWRELASNGELASCIKKAKICCGNILHFVKNKADWTKTPWIIITVVASLFVIHDYTNNDTVAFQEQTVYETVAPAVPMPTLLPTDNPIENTSTTSVFVTTTGKKYHKNDCYHIRNSAHLLELSINEATAAGYRQ